MEEIITNIKKYLKVINKNIDIIDNDLIDFVIDEVIDRTQLYLKRDDIPAKLERILANIVNTGLKKCIKNMDNMEIDQAINSVSDNGQSVSYANQITNYFSTASDNELFTGFSSLMSRYRRIKVVHTEDI